MAETEASGSAVQRVSLAGATLASLLSAAACSEGVGGDLLLFGRRALRRATASKREADAGAQAGLHVLDAHVVLAAALPRRLAFYGASGDVNLEKLDEAVDRARRCVQHEGEAALGESAATVEPLELELLGWCSMRPRACLAPSMREAAVTRALHVTKRCSIAPLLLLIGVLPASDGGVGSLVLSTEYACVQVDAASRELLPRAVHVLNLGVAAGEYGALAAVSPTLGSVMGGGDRLDVLAQAAEETARGVEALVSAQVGNLEVLERELQQLRVAAPRLSLPSPPQQEQNESPNYHEQLQGLVASLADPVLPPDAATHATAAEAQASGISDKNITGAPTGSSELSEMALGGGAESAAEGDPSKSLENSVEGGLTPVESRSDILVGSRECNGIGRPSTGAADNDDNQAREEGARERGDDPYAKSASGGSYSNDDVPLPVVNRSSGDHQ